MNDNKKHMWDLLKGHKNIHKDIHILQTTNSVGNELQCPHCGDYYMHHYGIELFNRHEDSEYGDHIELYIPESHAWMYMNTNVQENIVDGNIKNNPSSRRSGIIIKFVCENCSAVSDFCIKQHKGHTLLEWRYKEKL